MDIHKLKNVEKMWGNELWFHEDGGKEAGYTGKILKYSPGYQSSLHYHAKKHETMLLNSGALNVEYIEEDGGEIKTVSLVPGDVIVFPPHTPHRLTPIGHVVVFEVSTPHDDDDVYRLEPSVYIGDKRKK